MNTEIFSEAVSHLGDPYVMEALAREGAVRRPHWWRLHRIAACFLLIALLSACSIGTALAVSPALRQAVVSLLFPVYSEGVLVEIDEGHRTGSFDMEDTLFTFLEVFNREGLGNGITVKKEGGFAYTLLPSEDGLVQVIADCEPSRWGLLVLMERQIYGETSGLWQVCAYQIIDRTGVQT